MNKIIGFCLCNIPKKEKEKHRPILNRFHEMNLCCKVSLLFNIQLH